MFCYQCEQTAEGKGCSKLGICGKSAEVAALQDLLIYAVKGLSLYALEGRKVNINDASINRFVNKAIFSTLTNVNFDPDRFKSLIEKTVQHREELRNRVSAARGNVDFSSGPATFTPEKTLEGMVRQGEKVGIWAD